MPCFPFLGNGRPAIAPPPIVPESPSPLPNAAENEDNPISGTPGQQTNSQTLSGQPPSPLPPIDVENSGESEGVELMEDSLAYSLHSVGDMNNNGSLTGLDNGLDNGTQEMPHYGGSNVSREEAEQEGEEEEEETPLLNPVAHPNDHRDDSRLPEPDEEEDAPYNDENMDPLQALIPQGEGGADPDTHDTQGMHDTHDTKQNQPYQEQEEDVPNSSSEEEDAPQNPHSDPSSAPPPHPHLTRKHHHLRKKLDRQSRSIRLGMRSTSPLGLTLFDMDDRDITFSRQVFSGELSGGRGDSPHNQRREMDLRRRSARQNDTQNEHVANGGNGGNNDIYNPGNLRPDSNPGVVTFSHLKDTSTRPMSAHQVTFAGDGMRGDGMHADLEDEMRRHDLEGYAAPTLDLNIHQTHSDLNSQHYDSSNLSNPHNLPPNQNNLRPTSAHSRVQRFNFQQKNPLSTSPLHTHPSEDDDLDAIYEDDHNDFVETDLDHVWFRESTSDTPVTPEFDAGTPLISISESDNEGVLVNEGAEYKRFDGKGNMGNTWTKLPNQGILIHKSSSRTTSGVESGKEDVNKNSSPNYDDVIIALRDMIKNRRRTTRKPLSTIYNHFDRRNCGQFDARDLAEALYDLRLQSDEETARTVIAEMAINSTQHNRVSYAEFCVFIDDADHDQFFSLLASVLAKRRVSSFLALMSSNRETIGECLDGERSLFAAFNFRTAMTHREFAMGLMRLGLPSLSEQDILRLTRRFDVYGDGVVSVTKFVRAISSSTYWKQSTQTIEHHVECNEEALRPRGENMTLDVVNSALSLGIRVSSDAGMLWIVYEMLDSSLPPNWDSYMVTEKDAYGEDLAGSNEKYTVYVYSVNGKLISEGLEHPLAPHFRRIVKDHYLRSMYKGGGGDGGGGPDSPVVEEVLEAEVLTPEKGVEQQGQGQGQGYGQGQGQGSENATNFRNQQTNKQQPNECK
ncbi:hypothetical protein TrLO_g13023 [Triparma laevis f. longispina]|uniref:EF-hand domain-containing protein n=1 Tax=Triparma laevis f. longispina TaxID=1714387 RepID=A0A9W7FHR6_9STRA|nr:hypothetical protein TrLO_g13023 [Triparma laevis f. longispina]